MDQCAIREHQEGRGAAPGGAGCRTRRGGVPTASLIRPGWTLDVIGDVRETMWFYQTDAYL